MICKINAGDKFGRLTIIEQTPQRKQRCIIYKCRCDCGNIVFVKGTNLKKGYTKSCGCLQKEMSTEANKTHGQSKTKLYYVWQRMKQRCNNKSNRAYKYYGGRGIYVCKEWNDDYISFYEWSVNNGYKEGLTIDRIDNNEGYSPNNCRWVTMKVQSENRKKRNIELSNNPNAKRVNMYSLSGQLIKTYNTITEACEANNIKGPGSGISACCRGRQKTAHGYIWRYADTQRACGDIAENRGVWK